MKRLLSVLSVFCILWFIIQVSVWDKPDSLSPTEQDMHEGNADSDYASLLPTDSIHSQKHIPDMVRLLENPEVSSPTKRYMDKINNSMDYNYLDYENEYGYQYSTYIYEDDYDGDGIKEAFVAIGQKTGDTKDYLFGNLYFVSDWEIQLLEISVFIGKEPSYDKANGITNIAFDYKRDIYPLQAVYIVEDGLAKRQNPIERTRTEKAVVGNEFTPDADLMERMANAKDYREDDYELCSGYSYWPLKLDGMGLVNTTEHFTTYVIGHAGVIIEMADKEYLYADLWYTSNYMISPDWKEADFDGDGINELAMITYVKHGTGLWVESLYMTDQNEAGEWEMYEFLESDYCFQLREHFDTVIDGDDIGFVFDGVLIGAPELELFAQGVSYRYDVGNQIEFAYTPEGIEITAEVEGICTSGGYGSNDYPGYVISAQVKHLGNGNWLLENVCCQTEK
ncbi:MAG: hypothetical protein HDR09_22275 [Lachnospiraceae bacterium]|nr:hypothetical protein [Lachnospiraceae bacterium]